MRKVMLSMAVAMCLGGMARAGGDITPTVSVFPESWSGFYIGGELGYNWGNGHQDLYPKGKHAATADFDVNGMNVGLYAGYNWLLKENWLLGVEGEWNTFDASDSTHPRRDVGTVKTDETIELTQDWDASVQVRLGKVTGNYLPYLTGGIAWAGMNIKSHESGKLVADDDETMVGWTLGAGMEMAINKHLHIRIRYRYTDYGNKNFYPLHEAGGEHSNIQYNAHLLSTGVSYRF